MAVTNESINYYNKNVLRSLPNWDILTDAVVSGDFITISPDGVAGYNLKNTYNYGLKASIYRIMSISIDMDITQSYNYQNYVELVLVGTYKDSEDKIIKTRQSINISYLLSEITDGIVRFKRVLTMQNYDLESCSVSVINHTDANIILRACYMKRSQDIINNQISESIGFNISLNRVVGYTDGCEVYYDGEAYPTKIQWQEDSLGAFNGILVNDTKLITFTKNSGVLPS